MAEQLTFNDSVNVFGVGTGLTTLSGTATITYGTTNVVTGSLTLGAAGLLGAQTYTNLAVTQTGTAADGVTPIYTLTGSSGLTNISITYTGQAPTMNSASVALLSSPLVPIATGSGNVSATTVCFATGTQIRTARGEVAVEHLEVGDLVVTASGERRPIRWLGHRTTDCKSHPRPHEILPVCIAAHAFGEDLPVRDLLVSPGHAICLDVLGEVLIPAIVLVNGSTIKQVAVDEVTYWHVELDSHDVILAENLPAESYLEMGNRNFFNEADIVNFEARPDAFFVRTHADFCRPFHDAGPVVDAVKAQLRRHAISGLDWALTDALELHLEVDGQRLDPIVRGLTARFLVPANAKDVRLVSPTARPCETTGIPDARELGLCLASLKLEDGLASPREIALADPRLDEGFHSVEEGCRRWTAGAARLPAALWDGLEDGFFLRVELAGPALPRWLAPASAEAPATRLRLVAAS